ncbi:unnamed protein product, partial [Penicillium glandicola]
LGIAIVEKMCGKVIFKAQLAGRLLNDEHLTRIGLKAADNIPVSCIAYTKEPYMMAMFKPHKCVGLILNVKLARL